MAKKICNYPGCNNLIDLSSRYCEKHKIPEDVKKSEANKKYDKYSRNKKHAKFYQSKAWKVARDIVLKREGGLCVRCLELGMVTKADVVDHIIPISENWDLKLSLENLQPLCHKHHNQKTARERGRV